jgi:hypothetical protein
LVKAKVALAAERLRMDSEAMEATRSSQSMIPSDLGSSAMVNTNEVNGSNFPTISFVKWGLLSRVRPAS